MKITRRQLRQLINEHMLSPTFWLNKKGRDSISDRVMNDPDIHPMIKDLVRSGDESQIKQAEEFLKVLHPEYSEELDIYSSRQDSFEYDREFDKARKKLQFDQERQKRLDYGAALSETIFAGGPTLEDPDATGVTFDMANQLQPIYRKQRDRDEEIRKTADPRIVKMLDSENPEEQEMARTMASTFDGKPEAYETLTPEERQAQSLYDEFNYDLFPPEGGRYHDTQDGRLQRSYAPEIQQIRNAMKKRIEAAMDRGASSYDELYSAAYSTPGYDNLRKSLMKLPPSEFAGATGMYSDRPDNELMNMPGRLIDMYMADDNPHY